MAAGVGLGDDHCDEIEEYDEQVNKFEVVSSTIPSIHSHIYITNTPRESDFRSSILISRENSLSCVVRTGW